MSDSRSGRPVRFFVLLMTGWTIIRIVSTIGWPSGVSEASDDAPHPSRTFSPASAPPPINAAYMHPNTGTPMPRTVIGSPHHIFTIATPPADRTQASGQPIDLADFISSAEAFSSAPTPGDAPGERQELLVPQPASWQSRRENASRRWHLGSWVLWRNGSGPARALTNGRLGGSQIGARLDFDMTPDAGSSIAGYTRVSAAMDRPASPEAAIGLFWQPARRIPLTFALERRIALGPGGRNANALFAAGGFGPTPLTPSVSAEAYVQTGIVGFHAKDSFVDGKLSLLTPLRRTGLHAGMAVSGGAQPDVSRLDIGPEIQLRLPLPSVSARLSIEWRERIMGNAAPPSGPAITLAADF